MSGPLGSIAWGWLAVIVIAVVALALAGYLFRGRLRRKSGRPVRREQHQGRLVVLESTVVDADRRLLLVRCDDVEHLILTGGPADLVIDNDVRRRFAKPAQPQTSRPARPDRKAAEADEFAVANIPFEPDDDLEDAARAPRAAEAPPAQAPEAAAPGERAVKPVRAAAAPPIAAERPAAAARTRVEPTVAPAPRAEPPRVAARAAPAVEPPAADRNAAERKQRENAVRLREPPRQATMLPAASVPWNGSDELEGEIVRALRVEPVQPASRPQPRAGAEASVTLGDLAERLEEALAREVRAASRQEEKPEPAAELGLEAFDFNMEDVAEEQPVPAPERRPAAAPEPKVRIERADKPERAEARPAPMPPKDRPDRRERAETRPEPRRPAPVETERREPRAAQERQEEAPVISLSSRRREPVDPLEDEMARLLGELTGDQNRR